MSDTLAARVQRAKAHGEFAQLVDAIPYARFVGVSLRLDGDSLIGQLAYAERNIGNAALPALHGGTIASLLEFTAMFELLWHNEVHALPKTISVTVEYLRSGKAQPTFASAQIVRAGRRVAPVRVHAWQDDPARPIAAASVQFLLG